MKFDDFEIIVHGPPARQRMAESDACRVGTAKSHDRTGPLELDLSEDRYARLRLIPWWDQARLQSARILVVGAGAIGNEVIKLLTLLGIGEIYIVDLDLIEETNLTRAVLFRAGDVGRAKAEVAAERAREINPDVRTFWHKGSVVSEVGLGLIRHVDIVIGALDNREARLAVNRLCWKANRPWIDGAIEILSGVARAFVPPHGACYECTMSELDYQLLALRKSCALLQREDVVAGKIPTTPTTAAIVAAVEVQEALKLLHGRAELPVLAGQGFVYNGSSNDSYVVNYDRRDDCLSHVTYEPIEQVGLSIGNTFAEVVAEAGRLLGKSATLQLDRELVTALRCFECGVEQPFLRVLDQIAPAEAACPSCGAGRFPVVVHQVDGDETWADVTLAAAGFPAWDVFVARAGAECVYLELAGDRNAVLQHWGGDCA